MLGLFLALLAFGSDVVFRSGVSLIRVDAQVVDRGNRAIAGLTAEDFVLREEGRPQTIRNFATEEMPADVLLLLDVSGSMRTHVERIASAAGQAMRALGADDRVGIMVFDRATRIRSPFRPRGEIERELRSLLDQETFDGGTDITRGLIDAAGHVQRHARRDARRAIVILTDDQTERDRDEERVERALTSADAVLMALIAPNAMRHRPGPRPPIQDPLGGIILGRRMGSRTQSAGTAAIARASGGDSVPVDDASAFEDTLARIRQRYALHFHLPEGIGPGQQRAIEVTLSEAARRRYPDAEVRYRRVYLTPNTNEPITVSQEPNLKTRESQPTSEPQPQHQGGWRRVGGWPKAN